MFEKYWSGFWSVFFLVVIALLFIDSKAAGAMILGALGILFFVLLPIALVYRIFRFLRFKR